MSLVNVPNIVYIIVMHCIQYSMLAVNANDNHMNEKVVHMELQIEEGFRLY